MSWLQVVLAVAVGLVVVAVVVNFAVEIRATSPGQLAAIRADCDHDLVDAKRLWGGVGTYVPIRLCVKCSWWAFVREPARQP